MRLFARGSIFSMVISLLSISLVFAQAACPDLVNQALTDVDNNCTGLGRNEACYGYDQVEASFINEVSADTFTTPADTTPVDDLATLHTAPLNLDTGVWGVAVMNLQANMPNTLPGQNVTFVLLGDVEVEDAVAPQDAFVPSNGIDVMVSIKAGANIRSGPGSNYNVLGASEYQTTLQADGLSQDGEWLRVAFRDSPGWISRTVIEDNPDIASLPTLSSDMYTPMQAFYLRTGIGQPQCSDAPDNILLVQGPKNIEISLNINGADISLGSSGAIRVVEIDGQYFLEIIVFDGTFVVGGEAIHKGEHSLLCLSDENNRGLDGQSNDRTVTCINPPEKIDPQQFGTDWCSIESIPSDILHYGIDVLCPNEIPAQTNNSGGTGGTESQVEGVDCSTFSIPPQPIPATNFTLSWTPATGADNYIIAVLDTTGYEVSTYKTTGTSIGLNGGVGFPDIGAIHVRAYQGSNYACVATINFTRAPDPNEPTGGYSPLNVRFANCSWPDGLSFTVTWSGATPPVTVKAGSYSWSSSNASGSVSGSYIPISQGTPVMVSDSAGHSGSVTCPNSGL